MHDKRIKIRTRKQMNWALKPGGVRILNPSRTILQCLCCPDFYFKCFFNLLRRTLKKNIKQVSDVLGRILDEICQTYIIL